MSDTSPPAARAVSAYDEQRVLAAAAARGEPAWLRARRSEAARAFAAAPLPTPALRPWKYTDVTKLDLDAFAPAVARLRVEAQTPAGTFAGALQDAAAQREAVVREHLGSVVTATEGKFAAANAALWSAGVLVHAPRGTAFPQPVVLRLDAALAAPAAIFPRLLIVAEERADVGVVLRSQSGEAPLLSLGVIEIVAGAGARVRLVLDGRWGAQTQEFTIVRSRLARDADVQVSSLAIDGRLVKQTIEALLEGDGASSTIRGVALGDRGQHFDFVTLQDHMAARTSSKVEIRSALAGRSRSIYYGVTRVGERAAGAQAYQENRNLLLSEHAKADSDPVLEILTAEVARCGHGATVGPVDAEQLFYLQSRGLDRRQALQLLVYGFFQSVAGALPPSEAADGLYETVTAKLASAEL
ncbi:MAG: SufD family Fe-S cluster assembly protein [Dehalococcoidia bacterium]|nr:SufD family Fe-S cluster assembly protein [Dehalococcoidia bacterium]